MFSERSHQKSKQEREKLFFAHYQFRHGRYDILNSTVVVVFVCVREDIHILREWKIQTFT